MNLLGFTRRGNRYGLSAWPTWPHVSLGVSAHLWPLKFAHLSLHLPVGIVILGHVGADGERRVTPSARGPTNPGDAAESPPQATPASTGDSLDERRTGFSMRHVRAGDPWPEAVSDGLTLACGVCGILPLLDYTVDDAYWRSAGRSSLGVVCLVCLMARRGAQEVLSHITRIQVTGLGATLVLDPTLLVTYDHRAVGPSSWEEPT